MTAKSIFALVGIGMFSVSVSAGQMSASTVVFLKPETTSLWTTARDTSVTVPVEFPSGATKATLRVEGLGYEREYTGIAKGETGLGNISYTFELPAATSPETENVYCLTLVFDNGVTRTAKLGLIDGLLAGAEGATRCRIPYASRTWEKVRGRAVLPIPYGTETFSVDGTEYDTGLDGSQGWFAIGGFSGGTAASIVLSAGGNVYAPTLVGGPCGTAVILR